MRGKRGWFKHPVEHGLAAKGIKTRTVSREFDENIFQTGRMSRKPSSWDNASSVPLWFSDKFREEIIALPRISVRSGPFGTLPEEWFRRGKPQWFVAERNGREYLVDTEGYDYARYVARL